MENVSSAVLELFQNNQEESISSTLFESVLNEEANFIQENIADLREACTIDDLINVLYTIKEANIEDRSKRALVESLYDIYHYGDTSISEAVTEAAFNFSFTTPQFTGDPTKNAEYIAFLKEMEGLANFLVQLFRNKHKLMNEITDVIDEGGKNAQTSEDVKKVLNKCLNLMDEYNNDIDQKTWQSYMQKLSKFKKLSNTFNNKYSKITMAEKEVIDAKIDELINHIGTNYIMDYVKFAELNNDTPQFDRLLKGWEALKEVDRDMGCNIASRVINPLLGWLYQGWRECIGNLYYLRGLLGLKLKNTNRWKIVHALLKDKE